MDTLAKALISRASGQSKLRVGDVVICEVDLAMIQAGSGFIHGSLYLDALTGRNADVSPETVPLGGPGPKTGRLTLNPDFPSLDWVITGGESGPDARPMHPDWTRYLRDQCAAAGVPFFFKQWGEWSPDWNWEQGNTCSACVVCRDGEVLTGKGMAIGRADEQHGEIMRRIGKKAAGHRLDGVEHFNWPDDPAGVPA